MRKAFTIIVFTCSLINADILHAQGWQWAAGSVGGSDGFAIANDIWGNVYGTGATIFNTLTLGPTTYTGLGKSAVITTKYDTYGKLLWADVTTGGFANPIDIAADVYGNLYLFAYYSSPIVNIGSFTLTKPAVDSELFIAKYSPTGTVVWARNLCSGIIFGRIGISGENLLISSSFKSPSVTLGAYTLINQDPSGTSYDIFMAKLDTAGNVLWAKGVGGNDDDLAYGLAVTPSGDIYVSGTFKSPSLSFGSTTLLNSATSLFLVKYDSMGNVLWAKIPGGKSQFSTSLATDPAENVYIVGTIYKTIFTFGSITLSTDTFSNVFLAKYDAAGTPQWAKEITGNYNTFGYDATVDVCGNIWMNGNMPRGDTGFVVIAGDTLFTPPEHRDPLFIAEWSPAGTLISTISVPTFGDDFASIRTDGAGNIYLYGDFWGGPYTIAGVTLNDPNHLYEDVLTAKFGPGRADTGKAYKLVCISDTAGAVLQAPPGYLAYWWDDGSRAATRAVDSPGVYNVYCTGQCGKGIMHTVFTVNYGHFDTTYTNTDTSICLHSRLALVAPAGYEPYYWYNGDTTQNDTIGAPGSYWVACSGTCTIPALYDTFHVVQNNINLAFSLGDDTSVCAPYIMLAPILDVSYYWEDGATGSTDIADTTGIYYATVSRQGCFNSDSVSVYFPDLAQHLPDTVLCKEQAIQITMIANAPAGSSVLWSTGSTEHEITVTAAGKYWVNVTDAACSSSDTANIGNKFCYCTAFLPDAFTPNNDGINDYFHPIIDKQCDIFDYSFCVYNRWGQLIFTTHDPDAKWNGRFNNVQQDMGVYMYFLEYRAGSTYFTHTYKGDVTLVR